MPLVVVRQPLSTLLRPLVAAVVIVVSLVAAGLLARRMIGGFAAPPSPLLLLLCATVLIAIGSSLRAAWWWPAGGDRQVTGVVIWSLLTVAVGMAGAAISLPGVAGWAVTLFWALLIGAEAAWWFWRLAPPDRNVPSNTPSAPSIRSLEQEGISGERQGPAREPDTVRDLEDGREPELDGEFDGELDGELDGEPGGEPDGEDLATLSQQITRRREHIGESVQGLLGADFKAGERTQSLHVAFCPPLATAPTATAHLLDGPETQIKVAEIQCYGMRIDLRLQRANEGESRVLIGFEVRESSQSG